MVINIVLIFCHTAAPSPHTPKEKQQPQSQNCSVIKACGKLSVMSEWC